MDGLMRGLTRKAASALAGVTETSPRPAKDANAIKDLRDIAGRVRRMAALLLVAVSPLPVGRPAARAGSDRHRHRLEGGVAIDQVDALLDDAEALAVAPQPVVLAARKDALRILPRLDHDDGRADEILALAFVDLLDHHIADEMRGARGWRLHVDARML